jgi:NTE family protein
VDRALVLGPGGPVGTAWTAGMVAGLRRAGVDLGRADVIVGTSAGAIVGAALSGDLERLARLPAFDGPQPRIDSRRFDEVFAVLGDSRDPQTRLREVGKLALTADTIAEADHIAVMANLIGVVSWPTSQLLIPAVDVETGLPVVWDPEAGVPLAVAVAASTAFPATAPAITVDGRRYMDGALRAGSNVDLAAGADVVVILEPSGNQFGIDDDPAAVRILPDAEATEDFGPDPGDTTRWEPAYRSGVRQSVQCVERLRRLWA